MQQQRSEAQGEAEAREAIPDPKKPSRRMIYIYLALHLVAQFSAIGFGMAEMKLNKFVAVCFIGLTFGLLLYEVFFGHKKKLRAYRDEVRERESLRRMTRRNNRITSRPWPRPQRVHTGWDTRKPV